MAGGATRGRAVVLETDRLLLRPWRVAEAVVQRELWTERDLRVPPHRRIDGDGRPTVADLEESIRTNQPSSIGLLAVERKAARALSSASGDSELALPIDFGRRRKRHLRAAPDALRDQPGPVVAARCDQSLGRGARWVNDRWVSD